VCPAAA
jgi:hypothetical protein